MAIHLAPSELVLSPDGRIYHLDLVPEELADTILTVGDPARVPKVSQHFDTIEVKRSHREITTHTGTLNGKRVSVISTGMGTPNIDIVLNELDALANIDFETRTIKPTLKSLNIIRIGTSGGLQAEVPVGSFALTDYAIGMDNLLWFYQLQRSQAEQELEQSLQNTFNQRLPTAPYIVEGSTALREKYATGCLIGMTATCVGFYGPQNRVLRAPIVVPDLLDTLSQWRPQHSKIINFEMETAALYGMAKLLGHQACSISAVLGNRQKGEFDKDIPGTVNKLIEHVISLTQ